MTTAEHADFEALSAFVDGEAPEWADHVAGCPACRATAAELRALSAKVAAPVEPAPAAQRDAAIAAALGVAREQRLATGDGRRRLTTPSVTSSSDAADHEGQRARFARRGWAPGSWAMPAIAAVVLACVGFAGVILASTRSTDHETTFAGPALDSKAESAVAGAPTAPVGDLGDVPDAATLRARALAPGAPTGVSGALARTDSPPPAVVVGGAQSSATNTGNSGGAASMPASGVSPSGGSGAVIAPNAVGTRPCEERARAREPGLGTITYFATARRGNVPAYVLGFITGPSVTLLMLAQDGCAELLRSAGP